VTVTLSVVSVAVKTGAPAVVEVTVKVTTPEASLAPEAAEIVSVASRLDASVTVRPSTGLLPASFKVTVIVELVTPSAATEIGDADTVELAALTASDAKVTVAVCVIVTLSVVSVAVKTGEPTVEDFTVKVTTPERLEDPEAGVIVSVASRLEASETVLPGTATLAASFKVTVTVDVVTPSFATFAGLAVTVEVPASAVIADVTSCRA